MSATEVLSMKQLTKSVLAERLGVSIRSIEYMVKRGELPKGRRLGREVFWLESVVQTWQKHAFSEQLAWQPRTGVFRR